MPLRGLVITPEGPRPLSSLHDDGKSQIGDEVAEPGSGVSRLQLCFTPTRQPALSPGSCPGPCDACPLSDAPVPSPPLCTVPPARPVPLGPGGGRGKVGSGLARVQPGDARAASQDVPLSFEPGLGTRGL